MNYIIIIAIIGLLVLIHEAGHFIAAKSAGIPIATFSVGFGPKILRWNRNNTEYCISLIPIGGYVFPAVTDEKEFYKFPINKRIIMSAGGPLANILAAVLFFFILNIINSGISYRLFPDSIYTAYDMLIKIILSMPLIFEQPDKLSGIVGIISTGSKIIGFKVQNLLYLSAMLNINLAVFNLIPIPALDGGKIVLYLLEKIHPKLLKINLPLTVAGWLVIFGLMIYTTINDVAKLFA